MHLAKTNVPLYLRDKRARKRDRYLNREWKKACARMAYKEALISAFGKRSRIVNMLAECDVAASTAEQLTLERRKACIRFVLPADFSMIDNPERTLGALSNLARAMRSDRLGSVYIDFCRLTSQDLMANAVLDVLVDELSVQARQTRRVIQWRGNFPSNPEHVRFVRAMGVIKRLKVAHEYPSEEEERRLALFDKRCRHYVRAVRPNLGDLKSRVTADFADYMNQCLGTIGRQLVPSARERLCAYVGEILDNAEQHSGMYDWAIQGYLDTQLEKPMCEVVIFNFGRTIAGTFAELLPENYTRRQIQTYVDLHAKRKFFSPRWRKEDLYTLISLQGCVSSKNNSESDTRGNGTVDLIDFFQQIHQECSGSKGGTEDARMIIVSGSTYVLFDGKYRMQPNSSGIQIIAFNNENDLKQPPDAGSVRKLEGVSFPGTLIGLKFPLPRRSTQPTTESST